MFIVTTTLCNGENCKKYPHYNFQGESKGIYCIAHKKENMKVVGTFCIESNCTNIALYNLKNMKRKYCYSHKTENMVESGKPICKNIDCLIIATYGNKGEKPTHCFHHKETNMIDLLLITNILTPVINIFTPSLFGKTQFISHPPNTSGTTQMPLVVYTWALRVQRREPS